MIRTLRDIKRALRALGTPDDGDVLAGVDGELALSEPASGGGTSFLSLLSSGGPGAGLFLITPDVFDTQHIFDHGCYSGSSFSSTSNSFTANNTLAANVAPRVYTATNAGANGYARLQTGIGVNRQVGFDISLDFAFTQVAGSQMFAGLLGNNAFLEPASFGNIRNALGIGFRTTDAGFVWIEADGATPTYTDIVGLTRVSGDQYRVRIQADPGNQTQVTVTVSHPAAGETVTRVMNTNLPAINQELKIITDVNNAATGSSVLLYLTRAFGNCRGLLV